MNRHLVPVQDSSVGDFLVRLRVRKEETNDIGIEQQLLDAVADAVIVTDLEACITYWNRGAEKLYGWPANEVLGRHVIDVIPSQDPAGDMQSVLERSKDGLTWTGEFVTRCRDGSTLTTYMTTSPLRGENDEVIGVIGVARDVTALRELGRAQKESERARDAMLEALPDLVFRLSTSGEYLDIHAHDAAALVAPAKELLGKNISEFLPEDLTAEYFDAIERALKTSSVQTLEYPLEVTGGDMRHFEVRIAPSAAGEVIAISRDVTDRRRSELALRESRDRLQLAMESASMGTWDLDLIEGSIVWSQGMYELVQMPPEEFDERFDTFISVVHPEDRHVLVGKRPAEVNFNRDFRIVRGDGETRWLQTRGHMYRDEENRAVRMVGVSIDITERKLHEQALIKAKEAAEEIARIKDSFLANMSHEVRTPLTSIIGFADVLREETTGELQEMAHLVRRAGERLLITLESVLDLANLESGSVVLNPQRIDIVDQVRELIVVFSPEAETQGLYLTLESDPDAVIIEIDAAALARVLNNIITNALKFTNEGGITIRISADAESVTVAVSDTGIGIDDRFQHRLFDEFAQESQGIARSYEGVGLGLAISRRLIEMMHGTIEVESRKGDGTTFTLVFPR